VNASGFNLSEWSLNHKGLVYFFLILIAIGGIYSYQSLGRMEDPDFIIRQMVVSVGWPGATARQVEEQVTDKIEKRLQDTPGLDYLRSYSRPGQSVIYVYLKNDVNGTDIRPTWLEVRNMVNDIKDNLPEGLRGPYFNDRFDDVYGNIYALTANGFSYEEMRVQAEKIRRILLGIHSVKKVELLGVQPEKIYIEMDSSKLAGYSIDPMQILATVKAQNAMTPSGMVTTTTDNVYLRVTGIFGDLESIRNLPIRVQNKTFRLGDIAKVERSYADPPEPKMYYNGQPAVGIALSMEKGGNILALGKDLQATLGQVRKDLPLGMEISQVSNQPQVVEDSINEFVKTLCEAIAIVLIISFLSLGIRTGVVVALCIPLVIAGTFVGMKIFGIDLHKVSLGALIIALGLLVDDAIIAVEMMSVKLEQGWDRTKAACFAYTVTAFPMLTGTLITCAGFIPIGFSKGSASEFCNSIFTVLTISLLISWLVSVVVTPLLGYHLIQVKPAGEGADSDLYDKPFYHKFRQILNGCLEHRWIVLGITVSAFLLAVFSFRFLPQEFFPKSIRPELIVEMRLPEGSAIQATEQEALKFAADLKGDPNIDHYSFYVGNGAPRFVLTFEPVLPSSNFAQFVIVTKGLKGRNALEQKINQLFATRFANVRGNIKVLQIGPSDAYPVMMRVSGYHYDKVRSIAKKVAEAMVANPKIRDVNYDWYEKSKVLQLAVDQDKARMLGIDSSHLALNLQAEISGIPVSEFRENDKTVTIVFRLDPESRKDLAGIKNLNIPLGNGQAIPLEQIATLSYGAEEGLIWRRNLKPTITIQAEVIPGVTGNDAAKQVYRSLEKLRTSLPPGYSIEIGGAAERSAVALGYLAGMVPVMLIVIMILLMLQLQSSARMFLTLLTAPLGVIGVVPTMLICRVPLGFLAEIGILALCGIIIRNSVILIDQIERQIEAGESTRNAIINATVFRFRPIMLTASAAIMGMLPLAFDRFWGAMAITIAGGLLGATILTLLVLPTMYAAWFKVKRNEEVGQRKGWFYKG
jgi:multidrug efflux pump